MARAVAREDYPGALQFAQKWMQSAWNFPPESSFCTVVFVYFIVNQRVEVFGPDFAMVWEKKSVRQAGKRSVSEPGDGNQTNQIK
jgi:hypothetical protein